MEVSGQHHGPAALPRERTPISIVEKPWWAPEVVWTFWRSEKSLVSIGTGAPDRAARSAFTDVRETGALNAVMAVKAGFTGP
jgi:hypothetical protein